MQFQHFLYIPNSFKEPVSQDATEASDQRILMACPENILRILLCLREDFTFTFNSILTEIGPF
jgi:hypothetical protein